MKKIILYILFLFIALNGYGEVLKVTGTVVSCDEKEPLMGVQVYEKERPANYTLTDFDANFSISVEKGNTLVFYYPVCVVKELVVENDNPLNVELLWDSIADEIFVGDRSKYVILKDTCDFVLPESEFVIIQKQNKKFKHDKFFEIKDIEIGRAKAILNQEITTRKNQYYLYGNPAKPLNEYLKQYIGFKHNGHRCVFIRLTAKEAYGDSSYIDKYLLFVLDGGNNYGWAIVDLDAERILALNMNGII